MLILVFFFFFGCPYEFIKCYLNRDPEEEDEDADFNYDDDIEANRQGAGNKKRNNEEDEGCNCKKVSICILLGLLGLLCQPIYLMFYILYAIMECYRRFGCWIFLASY